MGLWAIHSLAAQVPLGTRLCDCVSRHSMRCKTHDRRAPHTLAQAHTASSRNMRHLVQCQNVRGRVPFATLNLKTASQMQGVSRADGGACASRTICSAGINSNRCNEGCPDVQGERRCFGFPSAQRAGFVQELVGGPQKQALVGRWGEVGLIGSRDCQHLASSNRPPSRHCLAH